MATSTQFETTVATARATRDGVRTVAWLSGEHDLATADCLTPFLVNGAADSTDVVVDLSGVSFMDASTIAAIVRARSQLAESSRSLTVRSPSTLMERVFAIFGLEELIEQEPAYGDRPDWARSALETWVPVKTREPAPSETTQLAPEAAR